jgi:hypothetical protein
MFACVLITYQYINTNKRVSDTLASRMKTAETQYNISSNDTTGGDDYVFDTGNTPDRVTGTLNVSYDAHLGYVFHNDTLSLWAPEIRGRVICTYANGTYLFRTEPSFSYGKEFNAIGLLVLLPVTAGITVALTAVWPMLMSVDKGVNYLVDRAVAEDEKRNVHDTKKPFFQSSKCRRFKIIWLSIGGVVICALSGVLAHLISVMLGLPTIVKGVQTGECLFLDTATLGNDDDPYSPVNALKKLRDDPDASNFTSIPANAPRSEVRINGDGSVDFITNCESSLYQASTGAIWEIVPEYGVVCTPIPEAFQVIQIGQTTNTKCTLGSWTTYPYGTAAGFTHHIDYGEWKTGQSCGFLNFGNRWAHGYGNYHISKERKWEYCNIATQPTYLRRTDSTGNTQTIDFTAHITVDPRTARAYGWHTSGDEEIINSDTTEWGHRGTYVFDPLIKTDEDIKNYFTKFHFTKAADRIYVNPHRDGFVRPATFECRMMFTVANGNDFSEFQQPCETVSADVAGDDYTAGLRITTPSTTMCTVTVGFQDTDSSTVVSVNRLSPVILRGADKWKCQTEGKDGLYCDHTMQFQAIDPEVVLSCRRAVVINADGDTKAGKSIDASVKNPFTDLFDLDSIKDIIITIFIVIAILCAIGLVIWILVKLGPRCCCKKKVTVEVAASPNAAVTAAHSEIL